MKLKFWKMNGAGNDFIIINNMEEKLPEEKLPHIAARLCKRPMSLGADGFMAVIRAERGGDFKMLFFNSDGSTSEMCGNGARCICRYGYENGLAGEMQRVETTAGLVTGYRIDRRTYKIRLNDPTVIKADMKIQTSQGEIVCSYVELGDPGIPHAVLYMPGLKDMSFDQLRDLAREIRYNSAFPKGANVNFYDFDGDGLVEKTYERGVEDFTYACGTGTGSLVLVLTLKKAVSGKNVRVSVPGGDLFVTVNTENGKVRDLWLTGGTNIVAKGEITDEELFDSLS